VAEETVIGRRSRRGRLCADAVRRSIVRGNRNLTRGVMIDRVMVELERRAKDSGAQDEREAFAHECAALCHHASILPLRVGSPCRLVRPRLMLSAMRRAVLFVALLAALVAIALPSIGAQVKPVYSLGAAGLTQVLQRLQTTASVLHTGAHPDDEDSFFIARTARGDHARVAYLALNRGEGGQNIIGTELFEGLGVIRTEELLQARRLDGGEQFFTRTFDYGFSKTLEEAASKWNEQDVLGDMVRIIRMFRPLVIYSRFSGTSADGHGHHSFAGYLTPLAFRAAGDPARFPEQLAEGLRPWQPRKLYRGQRFPPDPKMKPTIAVHTGVFDPVLGRSYGEIASEGRSQHKSQAMGGIEIRGAMDSGLDLVESVMPIRAGESTIFDGIDVSVPGIASLSGLPSGMLQEELQAMAAAARRALEEYRPLQPQGIIQPLVAGLRATRRAREALAGAATGAAGARADADFLLAIKERDFVEALSRAAEVVVDPLADRETVVAGGSLFVNVRTFVGDPETVKVTSAVVHGPRGWTVAPAAVATANETGNPFVRREAPTHLVSVTVTVPPNEPPTQPYFLEQPRKGETYQWTAESRGLPFAPPLLRADVTMEIGSQSMVVSQPVQFRSADAIRGELRRNVNVTPPVTVGLDSRLLIVPVGTTPVEQRMVVQATSFLPRPVDGILRLKLPAGWTAAPAQAPFSLKTAGDQTSTPFVVHAPAGRKSGSFDIVAEAVVDGQAYARDVQVIAYPHIQTHRIYSNATATAQVFDLKVAPVKVGYVMGTGDEVPAALRRMGVDVRMIDRNLLATGDLSAFDTIVIGIRASQARPDFVANNGRLLQYVERGGTLIVQYQQNDYVQRNLPPFPAQEASRVTDENAPVEILAPKHPVFNFPNRITKADFDGWVQDRNLYAFTTFDKRYIPLLATADRGEPPQLGGQVYADVGKGRYVYTSYAWFRQLPAGVPGAYRQFANLISLSKAPR
jgi:LmbE family N-acetylglucosaminyl deacetylase